jgi:membrane protease YdiL (CAAX protease family)
MGNDHREVAFMIPDPPSPDPAETAAAPPPVAPPSPWGPWATVGFLLLILLGMVAAQMIVLIPWIVVRAVRDPSANMTALTEELQYDGDLLAVSTFAGAVATLGLVILLTKARRMSPREYLGLRPVRVRTVIPWALALLVFVVAFDSLSSLLDRPVVPESMRRIYETSAFLPLLWIAVVIVAPLWEEIVFRGFGFPGFRSSRLGLAGAIVVPALFWVSLHVQYDAYDLSFVFLLGLLFGYARERTGSVTVPIVLHLLNNLVATVQMGLLTK